MPRIGLVLGAGGVVGQSYHAGVLAALEHDFGWDPRTADVIVGTSAGSITGMLLRAGVPASELAAWAVRAPLSAEGQVLHKLFGEEHPQFDPFDAVEAYVRKIMVNEHTSWWRRAWRRNERSTDTPPESQTADDPTAFENRDAMWVLVQTLPPRQRAAVVLRYYEDLSEAETARVLGCSVGTVKSSASGVSRKARTVCGRCREPKESTPQRESICRRSGCAPSERQIIRDA